MGVLWVCAWLGYKIFFDNYVKESINAFINVNMKIHVKFEDKCLVVPCRDGKKSVKWLISEAVERFCELRLNTSKFEVDDQTRCLYKLYLPNGGGMLCLKDALEDVLDNDGFVELKSKMKIQV